MSEDSARDSAVDDGSQQRTPFDEIQKVTRPAPGPSAPRKLSNDDAAEVGDDEHDEAAH